MTPRTPKPRKPTKRQTIMALRFKFGESVHSLAWDFPMMDVGTDEDLRVAEVENAIRSVLLDDSVVRVEVREYRPAKRKREG